MANNTIKLKGMEAFHTQNKGFDILTFDFHEKEQVSNLNWEGIDKEKHLDELKTNQRLLRIVHPVAADKKPTDTMSDENKLDDNGLTDNKSGNAVNLAEGLRLAGLDSAHKIAAMPEHRFVREYAVLFGGDEGLAGKVHQRAVGIKSQVQQIAANVHNMASPHFRSTLSNTIDPKLVEYFENIPSYQELFGNLDYLKTEHSNSIFSPAAYFLDLMRITDEYITNPNTCKDENNIPEGFALEKRRPDLFDLKLNSENSDKPVPFLQIVNDILKRRIEDESEFDDAFKELACAYYPFNLPFNLPLAQIRLYLKYSQSSLAQIYKNFSTTVNEGTDLDVLAQAREALSLSCEEYKIITTSVIDADGLSSYYGYRTKPSSFTGSGKVTFNITKNLPYLGSGSITFVKQGKNVQGYDTDFDKELTKGDQIICGDEARTFAAILPDGQLVVDAPWKTDATKAAYTIDPQTGLNHVKNFLYHTGLVWDELNNLFYQNLDESELGAGLANKFFINNTGEDLPYLQFKYDRNDPQNYIEKITGLSLKRLDRINRFIRLGKKLNWSFADLDWVLVSIGASEIDANTIEKIARIKLLQDSTKASVDVLTALWHNMKTIGWKNAADPQDIFNRIFNNPALLKGRNPYDKTNNPPVPFNPDNPLDWLVDGDQSRAGLNGVIRSRLLGALRVNDNDLTTVAMYLLRLLGGSGQTIKLTLENLTALYRLTKIPEALDLSIDEYLRVLFLVYYPEGNSYLYPPGPGQPNNNILLRPGMDPIIEIKKTIDWLQTTQLSIFELEYILTGQTNKFVNPDYTSEKIRSFIVNLVAISQGARLTPDMFIFDSIDETKAKRIFEILKSEKHISNIGIILGDKYYTFAAEKFPINNTDFKSGTIDENKSKQIYLSLIKQNYIKTSTQDNMQGTLSEDFNSAADLKFLKDNGVVNEVELNEVSGKLLLVRSDILYAAQAIYFPLNEESFETKDIDETVSASVFNSLVNKKYIENTKDIVVKEKKTVKQGTLSRIFNAETDLSFLINDGILSLDVQLKYVHSILLEVGQDILNEHTLKILDQTRKLQDQSALQGLSGFLNTSTDKILVLFPFAGLTVELPDYIEALLTPPEFFNVPSVDQVATVGSLASKLFRPLLLVQKLELTTKEIEAVVRDYMYFNITDIKKLTLGNIQSLSYFKMLKSDFNDTNNLLISYFETPGNTDEKIKALVDLTGWVQSQISDLLKCLWPQGGDQYSTVAGVMTLKRCFDMSARIGVDIPSLFQLYALRNLPVFTDEGHIINENWSLYNELAHSVLAALNSKYSAQEFKGIYEEITGIMNTTSRNVLLGYAIWLLNQKYPFILKPSDLYKYLLIDVEMSGCSFTSYIAQGIASVQLYMQRCRMNLEAGVTDLSHIPGIWWEWMSSYRVWEVNRKIFLYPENYVEPTLRKNGSPLFKELSDQLLQADIAMETVGNAYSSYFEKFSVLANLVYCGSYNTSGINPHTGEKTSTLYLFGRTNTQPYTYYYRWFDSRTAWSPWEKIDISIASPFVSPAYAFNKLFIFWVEQAPVKSSTFNNNKSEDRTIYKASIKYSFYDFGKKWIQPQTLLDNIVIGVFPSNDYGPAQDENIKNIFNMNNLYWRMPHVLALRGMPGCGKITFTKGLANATGYGTQFEKLAVGDKIWAAGETRTVNIILPDNEEIIADRPWLTSADKVDYKIIPKDDHRDALYPFKGTGAITFVKDLTNVQGSGTKFEKELSIGDRIMCNGETRTVANILEQELIVDKKWSTTAKGADYTIIPGGDGSERLVVLYGAALDTDKAVDPGKRPFLDNPSHDDFIQCKQSFYDGLYNSLVIANKAGDKGNVAVGCAAYLRANLQKNDTRIFMLNDSAAQKTYKGALDRQNGVFKVVPGENAFLDNYWSNSIPGSSPDIMPGGESIDLLYHISGTASSIINVSNQPGWLIFNNGDESFLVASIEDGMEQLSDMLFVRPLLLSDGIEAENLNCGPYTADPKPFNQLKFTFVRLSTATIGQLSQTLFAGGIDALLTIESQKALELPFNRFYKTPQDLPQGLDTGCLPSCQLDFNGPNGLYFWEIFFHAPFLIAGRLNANQRFDEARRWYQYIFNPTVLPENSEDDSNRVWRFLPFRQLERDSLTDILSNKEQIEAYNDDPFNPDAVARLRTTAYPKAIVMKYIDNLLDWGDKLFANDTRESINEATNLYVLAAELLGKRPEIVGEVKTLEAKSFREIREKYPQEIPEFLIQVENAMPNLLNIEANYTNIPFNEINSYFCVPENSEFIEYWDRVEDRLYKIRHCMNIKGIERQLPLFEPPLDVRAFIQAVAAGGGLSVTSQLEPAIPFYRFEYMLEKAKNFTSNLMQLGSSLLSALEKRDAEELNIIRTKHEQAVLNLTTIIKEQQIEELKQSKKALEENMNSAKERNSYYTNLLNKRLSPGEIANIAFMTAATIFNVLAGATRTAAAIGYAVPNAGSPFAMTYGGREIGAALTAASGAFEIYSTISNFGSQLSLTLAGYERRAQEWEFQAKLAGYDIDQISAQVAANDIRFKISEQELTIHQKNITQNKEMEEYLKSKFTNKELYNWMVSRLSQIYFQAYSLAFDIARSAQRAYQYEFNTNQSFINFGYWDNLHKGLVAGEGLMLALNQMEKIAIDNNSRSLEIDKTISLAMINPRALWDLKTTGECIFELSEKLFDSDFPGHYDRKIKSLSVSIPAVVGPYENIKATLTQLSNQVILKDDLNAVKFLLGDNTATEPGPEKLRSNWWINQQVALSKGMNDSGVFELNFRDEQYLPFEGTGAVSTWRLSMPPAANRFDFSSISDVIINLKYTAQDGGKKFRGDVTALQALKKFTGASLISFSQEYSGQWFTFLTDHTNSDLQTLKFNLPQNLLPIHVEKEEAELLGFSIKLYIAGDKSVATGKPFISFKVSGELPGKIPLSATNDCTIFFDMPLKVKDIVKTEKTISFYLKNPPEGMENVPDTLKKDGFLNPDEVKNIGLILYYQGDLRW